MTPPSYVSFWGKVESTTKFYAAVANAKGRTVPTYFGWHTLQIRVSPVSLVSGNYNPSLFPTVVVGDRVEGIISSGIIENLFLVKGDSIDG